MRLKGPIRLGNKGLNLKVTAHHQRRDGRLDPTYPERTSIVAVLLRELGVEPRHVHAVQPVCLTARPCGVAVASEVLVGLELGQGLFHGIRVRVADEDALHGALVLAVLQNLVDEQLPFAVAISCVDDRIRLFEQGLEVVEEVPALLLDQHLPFLWNDGQVGQVPALVLLVVLLWHRLFQEMTCSPCHDVVSGLNVEP